MKNRFFSRLQQHRTLLISLSAIVIFITTYLLILPAFTLEKDTAKEQGGITVSSEEPEGALSYEGKGFKVVASVDENAALPENTTLNVKEIEGDSEQYAGFYEEALKAVKEEGKVEVSALSFAKFYDMALRSDSKDVELSSPATVTVSFDPAITVKDADHVRILRIKEDADAGKAEAEILKSDDITLTIENGQMTKAGFKADGFAVYAVVGAGENKLAENVKGQEKSADVAEEKEEEDKTADKPSETTEEQVKSAEKEAEAKTEEKKEAKKSTLTAEGKDYTITLEYDDQAQIPEGAKLKVSEIKEGSDAYKKYLKESAKEIGVEKKSVSFARFFDVEITKDGEKVEPAKAVQVKIAYKNSVKINESEALRIVHFADSGTEVISAAQLTKNNKQITYFQDSFSVTGTIITDPPVTGKQYVVIVKYNNKYYSVHNEGSLEEVDSAYNPETNKIDVDVLYPLLWTYSPVVDGNSARNLKIPAVASGFYGNNLPSGYYYRFINPNSDSGISTEDAGSTSWMSWWSALAYDNHTIHGINDGGNDRTGNYIGVSATNGLHIVGNQNASNAAEVYLAELSVPNPSSGTHDTHMVNHIDISIEGGSTIKLPLAYGDYYDAPGGNKIFTATPEDHILEMTPDIPVTLEDIKNASITASAIVNGERKELDNVFYITGYSQNHETGEDKLAQVRIEGSFKVSNIPVENNADNREEVKQARKDNPIDYTVSVSKTTPVAVTYNGQQLYDAYGNQMVFNVPISLSASFNYWDEGNKCPPLHVNYDETAEFVKEWKDGIIVGEGEAMSGMDFELGTAYSASLNIPAIEINKIVQREDGTYLQTTEPHDINVDVYHKSEDADSVIDKGVDTPVSEQELETLTQDYERLHKKNMIIGQDGVGAIYDYDVNTGMIYIKEDENSIDQYLKGTDGKLYQYVSTKMETEYAWRTDGDEHKLHQAGGTVSVPEVLGPYSYEGTDLNNGFLEFFIYNTYKEIETVNVPIDKSWENPIDADDTYTWTSTFELEEMEVHVSGPVSSEANTSVWRKVSGVNPITIQKGDNESSRTFSNLPKYRNYPNGGVYRIMYSVDETAYELRKNGAVISKWDNIHGLTEGNVIYAPEFPHDAGDANDDSGIGENDPRFYHVIVTNHEKNETIIETLTDLKIKKAWPADAFETAGVDERDAYATFQLKRYVTREFRSYDPQYYDGTDCTVQLIGHDGNTDNLLVKKGAKIRIIATFFGTGAVRYTVDGSGEQYEMSRSWDGDSQTKASDPITIKGNTVIRGNNASWHQGHISEDHLSVAAGGDTETEEDTIFTNENHIYTLNKTEGWEQQIDNLPLTSESTLSPDGQQTINHYSYYFSEVDSNPKGFYPEFKDNNGDPMGNASHRITDDHTTVTADNKPIPPFYVKKEWHDIEDPDNYPEIRFTLYQGVVGNDGKVQEGSIFVGDNGESYANIPLNSDNDWTWKCPGNLPTVNDGGQSVGYYVVESTNSASSGRSVNLYNNSTLNPDGTIETPGTQISAETAGKDQIWLWDYYNNQNDNHAYRNDQQMARGWDGGFAGNTGTLKIVNRSPKYMQMDVKKKIMEYQPDGSLATTTGWESRKKDIVLKIQLMRRVYLADAAVDSEPLVDWTNYGTPFYVGYDSNGHDIALNNNDFDVGVGLSAWHWTILDQNQENGLPAYGYYTKDNGEIVKVHYRYIPFEVGAYKNTDEEVLDPEFDWFVGLQPNAWDGAYGQVRTFKPLVGQDQDRLMNVQASDLEVDKEWGQTPDNVEEVYVKIWRQAGNNNPEDFTNDIATRTDILDVYGFVDDPSRLQTLDNGVLVLGLTPETGGVLIHNVLMTPATENANLNTNYYEYWIEEVGYKDKDGNIYLNSSGSNATSTFFPEYDKSDSNGSWVEEWKTNPEENRLKLSTKGKNKLRVKNNPTKDIEVQKKWVDENGNELDGPWNKPGTDAPVAETINFKVKRSDGQYLSFGGSDTLSIASTGQRAVVRSEENGSTAYTVTYVSDDVDQADIGNWKTLVHGLQKYDSNGAEYTYTIEEIKDENGKPLNGNNEVIQGCHSSVVSTDNGFIIKNEKVVTSLAIEKVFDGSVELTDEQKQKITFTVTGPNDYSKTFTYGVGSDGLTWQDGVLVIKDIEPGEYTVVEANDDPASIFGSGTSYTHVRTYRVGQTQTTDQAIAAVTEGDRTDVTITNTYNEKNDLEVKIIKIDETTRDGGGEQTKLANAEFTLYKNTGTSSTVYTKYPDDSTATKTTSADEGESFGTLTYTELPDGQYKISETKSPSGYGKTDNNDIYFDIQNGVLTRYDKEYGAEGRAEIQMEAEVADITYVREESGNAVFTVGNEPGKEIPFTGGRGTTLLYILGSMMVAGAGILLMLRRKRAM